MALEKSVVLKEAITSIVVGDFERNNNDEIAIMTAGGNLRVLRLDSKSRETLEIASMGGFSATSMCAGNVTGTEGIDFVMAERGGTLRIVSLHNGALDEVGVYPLGTEPTALAVLDVLGTDRAGVVVATNDCAIRCYGWLGDCLDKMAHKSVDYPIISIGEYRARGIPYSRLVIGDNNKGLYLYQYADDRLHEIARAAARGAVTSVTGGNITGGRLDEIVCISDEINITVFTAENNAIKAIDNLKATSKITSAKTGNVVGSGTSNDQIIVAHENSNVTIMSLEGRRLVPTTSLRTGSAGLRPLLAIGRPREHGSLIYHAVDRTVNILSVEHV